MISNQPNIIPNILLIFNCGEFRGAVFNDSTNYTLVNLFCIKTFLYCINIPVSDADGSDFHVSHPHIQLWSGEKNCWHYSLLWHCCGSLHATLQLVAAPLGGVADLLVSPVKQVPIRNFLYFLILNYGKYKPKTVHAYCISKNGSVSCVINH